MAKTNEQIMDDLADKLAEAADQDPDKSIFDGLGEWQTGVLQTIHMIEAFQAGEDLTKAKLIYRAEDMQGLSGNERALRLSKAMIFADSWRAKRAA